MSAPTIPAPDPPEASPPETLRPLGGLRHLILFLVSAVALFFTVQMAAFTVLLHRATVENPDLTRRELTRQVIEREQFNAFTLVPVQTIFFALLLLLLYAFVRQRGIAFVEALALQPIAGKELALLAAAGALLAITGQATNALFPPPQELPIERLFSSQAAALLVIVASLAVAPLAEELVFRGYIYRLVEGLAGRAPAILTSGLLFGAIHVPQLYPGVAQMGLIVCIGLVFSLARARTGSTLTSVCLHFAYNATLSALFLFSDEFRQLAAFS